MKDNIICNICHTPNNPEWGNCWFCKSRLPKSKPVKIERPKPIPKGNIDLDYIIDQCEEYLKWINSPDYHEDKQGDAKYYVFEAVIESVYGTEIWDYINSKTDE